MRRPQLSRFILIAIVLLLTGAVLPPQVALGQAGTPPTMTPTAGYTYTIQRGDSWSRISRQTGVPVATLKANNPQAIHPQDWLYQGERLFIPEATTIQPTPESAADAGFWYQVKAGDAWGTVAKANGVTVQALLAANPSQVQPNRWLFTGQWIWIPGPDSPTAPDRVTITMTPSPTLTSAPTATPVPTATLEPTVTPSSTSTAEPTITPSSTPTGEPTGASVTPDEQDALSAVTEAAATVAAAAEAAGLAASAAESAATAVAAANSIATSVAALSTQIALLNLVTTPVVVSPTPVATATATPEEPTATVTPEEPAATPAAATQTPPAPTATRAATSTRAATATAIATRTRVPTRTPTTAPTSAAQTTGGCLLDKVIVANQAFDRWGQDGFQTAIKLYQDVLADTTSKACGKTANELELLRDYARFRLILSYVTSGQAKLAEPLHAQMEDTVVKDAADTFFEGLKTSGSIVQSCRYVIASIQAKPADWRWLTELGLPAKPIDVCPMG